MQMRHRTLNKTQCCSCLFRSLFRTNANASIHRPGIRRVFASSTARRHGRDSCLCQRPSGRRLLSSCLRRYFPSCLTSCRQTTPRKLEDSYCLSATAAGSGFGYQWAWDLRDLGLISFFFCCCCFCCERVRAQLWPGLYVVDLWGSASRLT